ncbi:MAG: hypothetical protein MJ180_05485, partial [Candidatus Gastranaerophilales bacterium]|nr:hypothetical protein [Candidatus Gastranaerophilales bacterium]
IIFKHYLKFLHNSYPYITIPVLIIQNLAKQVNKFKAVGHYGTKLLIRCKKLHPTISLLNYLTALVS